MVLARNHSVTLSKSLSSFVLQLFLSVSRVERIR